MGSSIENIRKDLHTLGNPDKAKILTRFFKTGRGEYGEGDVFLGITVPEQRRIAKKYPGLSLNDLRQLLASRIHEHRMISLLILIARYRKADEIGRKEIFDFYLDNIARINNWDLVDLSAPHIVGDYLLRGDRSLLYRLAHSRSLWERRIAIMATFAFIRKNQFEDTFSLARMLLQDRHDLIHKAVGWMLREIGKRDREAEEQFLRRHCREMPRTMLRYAIERFDAEKRQSYLKNLSTAPG
ncbi:MAG: DNA alkylation repair protein [Nitrospirota bacterium]